MRIQRSLQLKIGGKIRTIQFGRPSSESEKEEMFKLRHRVYSKKGFIDPSPSQLDKDEFDTKEETAYFIAKIEGRVLGAVRLIFDTPLPTERFFQFSVPPEIKKIPEEKRAEVSRLVVEKYNEKEYLPRNLVTLFLIECLVAHAEERGIDGGYSFIKESLLRKLDKLNTPLHFIDKYKVMYPSDGVLFKYFSQENDKVAPVFFLTEEIHSWTHQLISNERILAPKEENVHFLREGIYNFLLRRLKII